MKKIFILIWVLLFLSCEKKSRIVDESGFYFLVEEDSLILMKPRIQPHQDGYGYEEAKKRGMVPNEQTARMIAESVWLPIYGTEIYTELPFVVSEQGDSAWFVEGSLPRGLIGGTCEILISKKDGRIIYVNHQQ